MNVQNIWVKEDQAREIASKFFDTDIPPGVDALYTLKVLINKKMKRDEKIKDIAYILFECPHEEIPLHINKEHLKDIITWRLSNPRIKSDPEIKKAESERWKKAGQDRLDYVYDQGIESTLVVRKSRYQ